jgi:hypothetical protein
MDKQSMALNNQNQSLSMRRCLTVDSLFLKSAEIKPAKHPVKKEIRDSEARESSPLLKIFQTHRANKRLPLHKLAGPSSDKRNDKN